MNNENAIILPAKFKCFKLAGGEINSSHNGNFFSNVLIPFIAFLLFQFKI